VQEGTWFNDSKMEGRITYPGGGHVDGSFINGVPVSILNEAVLSGNDTDP